jgi:hypothetical protein
MRDNHNDSSASGSNDLMHRQLFLSVTSIGGGAWPHSEVGVLRLAASPNLCVTRQNMGMDWDANKETSKSNGDTPLPSPLRLEECGLPSTSPLTSSAHHLGKFYFEFEFISS